jgi:hypothetical protein
VTGPAIVHTRVRDNRLQMQPFLAEMMMASTTGYERRRLLDLTLDQANLSQTPEVRAPAPGG